MNPPRPTTDRDADRAPELSVVVPLFNEAGNLGELHRRLTAMVAPLSIGYELVLVDDGSRDGTPALLDAIARDDPHAMPVRLSRNFGHQAAVSAGLSRARGRAVVVMDGDLQDPPELIPRFLDRWRSGVEVVYAVRRNRKEGGLKRAAYHAFYRLLGAVSELEIPPDSGDFCLMDRRVVDAMLALPERRRFVRGLRAFVGFRQAPLEYDRAARASGRSQYSVRDLFALAVDGLVSFSGQPLRLVTYLGLATAGLALALAAWVFYDAYHQRSAPRGWASTMAVVLFMGSVQLISLGIIGEYIRLIFLEAKGRPTFIIRDDPEPGAGPGDAPR